MKEYSSYIYLYNVASESRLDSTQSVSYLPNNFCNLLAEYEFLNQVWPS